MKPFRIINERTGPKRKPQRISLGFLSIFVLTTFACTALNPTATPTPTGQIGAVEIGTPELKGDKKDFAIWTGTITSQTSRQYMSNSKLVNTCETDWITDLDFAIDPTGELIGSGQATISPARTCTPVNNLMANISAMTLSVQGHKDSTSLFLNLGITDRQPASSGDFGGYILLNNSGTCPSFPSTIQVPLKSPTTAETNLNLSATMTGCGGSGEDKMSNQSLVKLQYKFKCSEVPVDLNDPVIQKLCQ